MKGLLALVAIIAGIVTWACGVGFAVTIIALVLKWCGVPFLAGMSSWLPVQSVGGWILGAVTTAATAGLALT